MAQRRTVRVGWSAWSFLPFFTEEIMSVTTKWPGINILLTGSCGKHKVQLANTPSLNKATALEQSHTCSLPQALQQAEPIKRSSARPRRDSSLHTAVMEDLKSQLAGANQQNASWRHRPTKPKWSPRNTAQCENGDGKTSQWSFRDGMFPRWQVELNYTEKAGNHNKCLTHVTGDRSQEIHAGWMVLYKELVLTLFSQALHQLYCTMLCLLLARVSLNDDFLFLSHNTVLGEADINTTGEQKPMPGADTSVSRSSEHHMLTMGDSDPRKKKTNIRPHNIHQTNPHCTTSIWEAVLLRNKKQEVLRQPWYVA